MSLGWATHQLNTRIAEIQTKVCNFVRKKAGAWTMHTNLLRLHMLDGGLAVPDLAEAIRTARWGGVVFLTQALC